MATSVSGNAITATAIFKDANNNPANPDAGTDIVFKIFGADHSTVRFTDTQAVADATATGTFAYTFVPTVVEVIYVEAEATVGGVKQAERDSHVVTWT